MATSILIANAALRKVGAKTIASFTAGTAEANFINQRYDEIRLWLLDLHPWNFATARKKLAQLSTAPVSEFDNYYSLPADFVRVIVVHDNDSGAGLVEHKVEDNKIACSAEEVWLKYVYNVTDPNKMPPLFREALACCISIEAATDLAQSSTLREQMIESAERAIRRARSVDGQSDFPERLPVGSWVTARSGRVRDRSWSW